ncbi:MAG: tRNA guanosine(34) transglycosylase Tgt [Planctomycetes bacterium]|nr:tRNA guanosine(34) transglycosylase Tgt [Planctomycetota bacterium]
MSEPPFHFELLGERDGVRRGRYHTPHGSFETPCFAPVGTRAAMKGVTPEQLRQTGAELILANAYHLFLRPGHELIARRGGLHRFMAWDGPILTDSGGYQIFSLSHLTRIDADGVTFASVVDGSPQRLTPERALEVQRALGPDIAMVLDVCPPGDAGREVVVHAHERTLAWARRARDLHEAWGGAQRGQAVFGIVQGGVDPELRAASARALVALDFDGYAVGGLSVGETKAQMDVALDAAIDLLPRDRPRYLMGVGTPEDFRSATRRGVDLFDCVTPTRHGRNNQAFTRDGIVKMRNQRHAEDDRPLDERCACYTCRHFSRAYLRHLAMAGEMLAGVLLSLHNIHYFQDVMAEIRASVGAAPAGRGP